MEEKQWIKHFEEINGRKPTVSELAEAHSEQKIISKSKNIKFLCE